MKAPLDWAVVGELSWFFSGAAEADAGVRSVQGGFEETMRRMALCGPAEPGQVPVHETRSTGSASDDAIERLYNRRKKLAEGRAVLARLGTLHERHRALLELQFGDELWFADGLVWPSQRAALDHRWGLSLALLCCTSRIVRATERVNARREKRGDGPVDAREAVVQLLGRTDPESRATVAAMVEEAEEAIAGAMMSYGEEVSRAHGDR